MTTFCLHCIFIPCVCEQQRLCRECADVKSRLSRRFLLLHHLPKPHKLTHIDFLADINESWDIYYIYNFIKITNLYA